MESARSLLPWMRERPHPWVRPFLSAAVAGVGGASWDTPHRDRCGGLRSLRPDPTLAHARSAVALDVENETAYPEASRAVRGAAGRDVLGSVPRASAASDRRI